MYVKDRQSNIALVFHRHHRKIQPKNSGKNSSKKDQHFKFIDQKNRVLQVIRDLVIKKRVDTRQK